MTRCTICHSLVLPADPRTTCSECHQDYHQGCWAEIGGCATYGCGAAAVARKEAPPVRPGGGWGDEKACPACGATIASSHLYCHCGAKFPWADPMTAEEYRDYRAKEGTIKGTRSLILILFLVSLLGVTAPVTGLGAGVFAYSRRDLLAGAHGTYLALGYGAAALGVGYTLVALLLAMGR